MLRVGLTGGLGSGKSTVAAMLRDRGAHILNSDDIARELMMRKGKSIYSAIVAHFGQDVVAPSGELDRGALARMVFADGRAEELNAIVHPAVIARQAELAKRIVADDPAAVVVIESALIFETKHAGAGGWRKRFDCLILVTAPPEIRIERYVQRMTGARDAPSRRDMLAAEARRRMAQQIPDAQKTALSDFVLHNAGTIADLEDQVSSLWPELLARTNAHPGAGSSR